MAPQSQNHWDRFKANRNPLAKIREIKRALPYGPGLPAMYKDAKEHGTVLGVPVLAVGRNLFLSRRRVIDQIEGRDGQTEV